MAEQNLIMQADIARVRAVDFTLQFTQNLNKLNEVLGITRKIAVQDGTTLKAIKVKGDLESGAVGEGDLIPLSHYETEYVPIGEATIYKWRKATSAEAIIKGGYDQAVGMTTDRMVKDVQNTFYNTFIGALERGTGVASGANFQKTLANIWGALQVLFEDMSVEPVYFVNPLDIAKYLGETQIVTQDAFGMKYVENFLGLGTVVSFTKVPQGTIIATPKENLVLYYINVNSGDIAKPFELTTDETGYIGINEYADKDHAQVNDLVMSGVTIFPERLDGIVIGTIDNGENPLHGATIAPEAAGKRIFGTKVSDMQDGVAVNGNKITGTLKKIDSGALATDWGAGYFLALKFSDLDDGATSVKVGLKPSEGSGLVELLGDPDMNGVFKITNKDDQKFRIVTTKNGYTKTQSFDLSGLKFQK